MNGNKAIWGLAGLITLTLGIAEANDRRDGRHDRREERMERREERRENRKMRRMQRIERICEGLKIMVEGENGSPEEFVLPIKHPKALKHFKKWASKQGCPGLLPGSEDTAPPPASFPPAKIYLSNLENASETVDSERGMIAFVTRSEDGRHGNTLGYLYFSPNAGQMFVKGESNSSGYPLGSLVIASYVGEGDIQFLAGETISIHFDGGKSIVFAFTRNTVIPSESFVAVHAATVDGDPAKGRFFWDSGFTDPL